MDEYSNADGDDATPLSDQSDRSTLPYLDAAQERQQAFRHSRDEEQITDPNRSKQDSPFHRQVRRPSQDVLSNQQQKMSEILVSSPKRSIEEESCPSSAHSRPHLEEDPNREQHENENRDVASSSNKHNARLMSVNSNLEDYSVICDENVAAPSTLLEEQTATVQRDEDPTPASNVDGAPRTPSNHSRQVSNTSEINDISVIQNDEEVLAPSARALRRGPNSMRASIGLSPMDKTAKRRAATRRGTANAQELNTDTQGLSPLDRAAKRRVRRNLMSASMTEDPSDRNVNEEGAFLTPTTKRRARNLDGMENRQSLSPKDRAAKRRGQHNDTNDMASRQSLSPKDRAMKRNHRRKRTNEGVATSEHGMSISPENVNIPDSPLTPGAFAVGNSHTRMRVKHSGSIAQELFDEESQMLSAKVTTSDDSFGGRAHVARLAPEPQSAPQADVVEAQKIVEEEEKTETPSRKICTIISVIVSILAIALVVVLSVLLTRDSGGPSPTTAPTIRAFNASRIPALSSRLETMNLTFPLNSTSSQFALNWIANEDPGFLDVDHADETQLLERFALAALYIATTGTGWREQCQFLTELHVCDWKCENGKSGVFCNSDQPDAVSSLILDGRVLNGSLPLEMRALAFLEDINFDGNFNLQGAISPALSGLTRLTALFFGSNEFDSIGVDIGSLTSLLIVNFGFNRLLDLPTEIGLLNALTSLSFSANQIESLIPTEIGQLTNLIELDTALNRLGGSFVAEIGKLASIRTLILGSNRLEGTLPAELGNLSNLETFDIGVNRVRGGIPTEIGQLINARSLNFRSNSQLQPPIPTEIGNLSKLTYLGILEGNSNLEEGDLPAEVISLPSLNGNFN